LGVVPFKTPFPASAIRRQLSSPWCSLVVYLIHTHTGGCIRAIWARTSLLWAPSVGFVCVHEQRHRPCVVDASGHSNREAEHASRLSLMPLSFATIPPGGMATLIGTPQYHHCLDPRRNP
jgi:hypothetical protein